MTKQKVINLYGGPGTGKSTTAAGVFYTLKSMGINCEYVQEYAKDKTWETNKFALGVQEYIFGKQSYRMARLIGKVDVIVTDSPLLLTCVYTPDNYHIPSLHLAAFEAYNNYDNIDIFLQRTKEYCQAGREQTLSEAMELDYKIRHTLTTHAIPYSVIDADSNAVEKIVKMFI